ncbi:MAG: malto-oligosyltrehalose synthase [Actinobacteria bacterium]|nr:malto-oligosyltrehalose synthase [Actinomycetota bacterium]
MPVPASTYRVQVRPGFDLTDAAELVGYLAELGVTHLYSAPLLQAVPGSAHGYDVADHARVNAELGGSAGLETLVAALRRHGLGLVVDIVPNHAGVRVPGANPAWWDVLRLGPDSSYAPWFDIDWSQGPLRLPILADDAALADLRLDGDELHYWEHRVPLAPGTAGGTATEVHARQHYRLVAAHRADTELNYRRFFAISELAALRVEDPVVFAATHAEVLRWYAAGFVDGIRIDHPDGLRDPAGYLARLRAAAPDAWLVVEKILEPGERLPPWPVAGTTGYDVLRDVDALFVDPAAESAFTALDTDLTGTVTDWHQLVRSCKRQVVRGILGSELARLVRLAGGTPGAEDALAELLTELDVYRTYLPDGAERLTAAAAATRRHRPDLHPAVGALLPRLLDPDDELAIRFQQTSGAVMAKGVEDTALYRWSRLTSLNEVGGDPTRFGLRPAEFHAACASRLREWPASMTTLSTHDTKRSEDVRARLAVLSELPASWAATVRRWMVAAPVPDPAMAQLVWQTVAGTWPIERERLHGYLRKAAREAGTATCWAAPDDAFEAAMHEAIDRAYDDPGLRPDVAEFAALITPYGWQNSLGEKLVQLTMPGIPDVYQGTELWDNSLVDPDNRRPVDFALRRSLLARLADGWLPPVDATGAVKLLLVSRALRLRHDHPERFAGYAPILATGPAADHLVAFDRGAVITVATRLPVRLARSGGWGPTTMPLPRMMVDVLTARRFPPGETVLADLLSRYPVALLTGG